jgi:predicted DNA-binding transcriptional regulator AlpA
VPFGATKLHQCVKDGTFPPPVVVGRRRFWLARDVFAWREANLGATVEQGSA